MSNTVDQIISLPQAEEDLLHLLGDKFDETANKNRISLIYKRLAEKDRLIETMSAQERIEILKGISTYKKHLIANSGEDILNNILGIFVTDIYKDSLHFFLEVLQNIDDAYGKLNQGSSIAASEAPLNIQLHEDRIVFEYKEQGFNFSDLFAITSFGNSTKKRGELKENGSVGEKGIGFKSIFDLMSKAKITSRYFSFELECIDANYQTIFEPQHISLYTFEGTQLTLEFKEKKRKECIVSKRLKNG